MQRGRFFAWLVIVMLAAGIFACGGPSAAPSEEGATPAEEAEPTEEAEEAAEPEEMAEPEPPFVGPVPEGALARIGKGTLQAMALSPDDQLIAVGTSIGTFVYRADDLSLAWYGETNSVEAVDFSSDGARLATGGYARLTIWDAATGKPIGEPLQPGSTPSDVAFSPDGAKLAVGSTSKALQVWDIALREKEEYEGHANWVQAVAWSPDGALIATGSQDADYEFGELFIWDASTGELLDQFAEAHTSSIVALAFSPDGSLLASGSFDEDAIVWDVASGEKQLVLAGPRGSVRSVGWSADGTKLAAGDAYGGVFVWDVTSGSEVFRAKDPTGVVVDVAFSSDGSLLYTANQDGAVAIRDATSGEQTASIEGFTQDFYDVAWAPDGQTFVASSDGVVMEWDPSTSELVNPIGSTAEGVGFLGTTAIEAVGYSPDGGTLALGLSDGRITLWDVASDAEIKTIGDRDIGHLNYVSGLDWSPDGTQIVTSSRDTTVILWDVETGEPIHHYELSEDSVGVNGVVFSADGSMAVAIDHSGPIFVVDTATGAVIRDWNPDRGINYDLALRPDGSDTFAVAHSNGDVAVWDLTTGEEVLTMEEALWHASAVAFSPDGSLIAGGDSDGNVALWDAESGKLISHFEGAHGDYISAVAFSPDGSTFATVSLDATILLWEVNQ
jgi:WD40 repeat protein